MLPQSIHYFISNVDIARYGRQVRQKMEKLQEPHVWCNAAKQLNLFFSAFLHNMFSLFFIAGFA